MGVMPRALASAAVVEAHAACRGLVELRPVKGNVGLDASLPGHVQGVGHIAAVGAGAPVVLTSLLPIEGPASA